MASAPDPECGSEELITQTEAVSICSTDVSYFRGHISPERWPVIPGHEYVGQVIEVGKALRGMVRIGDRITYWGQTDFGGLAEYRAIRPIFSSDSRTEIRWYTERGFLDARQAATMILPPDLPVRWATLIEPLTSVLRALLAHPPRPGDTAVVLGAGPTSLLATQVMRRCLGVGRIVVLERNEARRSAADRLGATESYDPAIEAQTLQAIADEHLGAFADYVFDALPHIPPTGQGSDVRAVGMRLLRAGGKYVLFGATSIPQHLDTWLLLAKNLNIVAAPFDVREFPMARTAHVMQVALNLILSEMLDLEPLITGSATFTNESSVQHIFSHYGESGGLKTSISFDPVDAQPGSETSNDQRNTALLARQ